eukprot:6179908-Pleurochrysis_carterae.AAC.4
MSARASNVAATISHHTRLYHNDSWMRLLVHALRLRLRAHELTFAHKLTQSSQLCLRYSVTCSLALSALAGAVFACCSAAASSEKKTSQPLRQPRGSPNASQAFSSAITLTSSTLTSTYA